MPNNDPGSISSKFYQQGLINTKGKILSYDFLPMSNNNILLMACIEDGSLEVFSLEGELVYRYGLGHIPLYCAANLSSDDISMASIANNEIRIHQLRAPVFNQTLGDHFGL